MSTHITRTTMLTIIVWQCITTIVYGSSETQLSHSSLPWIVIAEKMTESQKFCININLDHDIEPYEEKAIDPNANYAFLSKQSLIIKLLSSIKVNNPLQRVNISVVKYVENSWQDEGEIAANLKNDEIRLSGGVDKEGFYKLSFVIKGQDGKPHYFGTYAIVSSTWKKDMLGFCKRLKDEIEANPDSQLYRSCIMVSHIDHTMELTSQATFLSGKILAALSNMVKAKRVFYTNECPDLVIGGWNKIALKRFEGATTTWFRVFIPAEYNKLEKWPLSLNPDPKGREAHNHTSNSELIDVLWRFPKYLNFEWKDYEFFTNILKNKLNLDEERYYLYGWCANGIPTMALALKYPDRWAYVSIDTGFSYNNLAGNAFNLNFDYTNFAHLHENIAINSYDFASKCFQYYGCRNFTKNISQNEKHKRPKIAHKYKREKSPARVLYTIESLHNPKAYWVTIQSRKDENFPGSIDAEVRNQSIIVKTKNIGAYCLDLASAPVEPNKPIKIIENDVNLGLSEDKVFVRRNEIFENAICIKNRNICGPIQDAFTSPYVVIWGTESQDGEFIEASKNIANILAHGAPCFADNDIQDKFVRTHNLIITGRPKTDSWISKIYANLPVKVIENRIIANGKSYQSANMGFILIYPNPLNPEKYVAVFSATSPMAMINTSKAYLQIKSNRPADIGVYEINNKGNIKWHILEKFNTAWGWHKKWGDVLVETDKQFSELLFCQWITQILRKQLKADIAICNSPFRFFYLMSDNKITCRNLFTNLRNSWIVKVSLKGKDLKKLLMMLHGRDKGKTGNTLVCDGIAFEHTKSNNNLDILTVEDLDDNKHYTIAVPLEFVANPKIQMHPDDYQIVGDGYLILLLKEYLHQNADINTQLNSLKLNVL